MQAQETASGTNILSSQALDSFWFTASELRTRSLYLWPIGNAHALYSKMVGTDLTTPTGRGLYAVCSGKSHARNSNSAHGLERKSVTVTENAGRSSIFFAAPPLSSTT